MTRETGAVSSAAAEPAPTGRRHFHAIRLSRFLLLIFGFALCFAGFTAFNLYNANILTDLSALRWAIEDALGFTAIAALVAVPWRLVQRIRGVRATNTPIVFVAIVLLILEILVTRETLIYAGVLKGRFLLQWALYSSCARPEAAVLETERQAVLTARTIWFCLHPELEGSSEQSWLEEFGAELQDGGWHVYPIIPWGYIGGGVHMELDRQNGRLLNIYFTQ